MLCTSGFLDDVIFAHDGPHRGISIPVLLQRRRAQDNALLRLSRVLNNDVRRDRRVHRARGARRRGRSLQCTIALLN